MATTTLRVLGTPLAAVGLILTLLAPTPASAATPIGLGTAASFAVLAGSTATNTGPSTINGDVGVSPGTALTGFSSATVSGTQHSKDDVADQAQSDLTTAYSTAAGQSPTATVSADLGGQTLAPGVYAGPTLGLTGTLTLDAANDPNAIFVFQAESTLTTASTSVVALTRGANPCNVFWQVGSSATLGTNSVFTGSVLALTSISATTGAKVTGRLLARDGATTLDSNTITVPSCAAVTPTPTATATPTAGPTATTSPTATASPAASATATPGANASATPVATPGGSTGNPPSAGTPPGSHTSTTTRTLVPGPQTSTRPARRPPTGTRPATLPPTGTLPHTGAPTAGMAVASLLFLASGLLLLLSGRPSRRRYT